MTVMSGISLAHGNLMINGRPLLSSIHENITLTPDSGGDSFQGAFLGATASASNSRHVFPLGILNEVRYICCFRFNLWWMTQTMGTCGRELPKETQFLLVESTQRDVSTEEQTIYCVFLPLLEGKFRSALQGNERNELEICVESGDPEVETAEALHSLYIAAGTDPFKVITDAVRAVEAHFKSFCHREKKKLPDMLNWFGWCTWDAFYTDVSAEGVKAGLESFIAGGTPPRFLIIDDGWQSITTEKQEVGTQFARRLIDIKENHKFRKDGLDGQHQEDHALSLQHLVQEAKDKYNLKYVYAWHSIVGYWGGVSPGAGGMERYQCALAYPVLSAGVLEHQPDLASDALTVCGIGLVNPKQVFDFYNDLHSYLASSGIDGVKVDVQNILETLGAGHGGRVQVTRQYQQALEASVARHFPDNGCIACMCHNTDGLYSSKQTAVARASEDFFPRDPASHTIHVASLAYNSLFLGEFMQPDWDMFHSLHPAAEYHAAARAVGGCGIYVSDKPGHHDFNLLKRLVLPDGSILRAELPGRPTRDCLFVDPTRDNSLLKIWNLNKHTGVLGAFNCQGAGWCKVEKINKIRHRRPEAIAGSVLASDVELLQNIAHDDWNGDTVIYSHRAGELLRLHKSSALAVTLKVLEYEVFTIVPLKSFSNDVAFAPVGLYKMFNSGAAIKSLEYKHLDSESSVGLVKIEVHGCGEFGAYSSRRPESCFVDSSPAEFAYNPESGLLTFDLRFYEEGAFWNVEIII